LEQLLVIDHENEKMLRNIMSTNKSAERTMKTTASSNFVERPALQRQLPFMPGRIQTMTPPAPQPQKSVQTQIKKEAPANNMEREPRKIVREENAKTKKSVENILSVFQNKAAAAPKSRLKDYAQAARMLQLSSKYA
jgi:hypothetical protein